MPLILLTDIQEQLSLFPFKITQSPRFIALDLIIFLSFFLLSCGKIKTDFSLIKKSQTLKYLKCSTLVFRDFVILSRYPYFLQKCLPPSPALHLLPPCFVLLCVLGFLHAGKGLVSGSLDYCHITRTMHRINSFYIP